MERSIDELIELLNDKDDFVVEDAVGELELRADEAVDPLIDALSHRRCYKDAWNEEDVLNELKKQSGTQFDPEIIDVFFEVYPTIKDIQNSLPDEES